MNQPDPKPAPQRRRAKATPPMTDIEYWAWIALHDMLRRIVDLTAAGVRL